MPSLLHTVAARIADDGRVLRTIPTIHLKTTEKSSLHTDKSGRKEKENDDICTETWDDFDEIEDGFSVPQICGGTVSDISLLTTGSSQGDSSMGMVEDIMERIQSNKKNDELEENALLVIACEMERLDQWIAERTESTNNNDTSKTVSSKHQHMELDSLEESGQIDQNRKDDELLEVGDELEKALKELEECGGTYTEIEALIVLTLEGLNASGRGSPSRTKKEAAAKQLLGALTLLPEAQNDGPEANEGRNASGRGSPSRMKNEAAAKRTRRRNRATRARRTPTL